MKQQATFAKMKVQEREIRRQYFIDAAIRQLKLKDPGQVTIKDIAKDLKVSVPSVYTYFAGKDDLYLEILRRDTRLFEELIKSKKNSVPEKSFQVECRKLTNSFMRKKEISSLLIYFIGKQRSLLKEQRDELNKIHNKYLKIIKTHNGYKEENIFNLMLMLTSPALSPANEGDGFLAG